MNSLRQASIRFVLDCVHLVVGKAEMVPDLMNDDMGDQVFQRDAGFVPFSQQRTAE